MGTGIVSHKIWMMWGRSSTLGGGDRAVDKHQAFNPMLTAIDFPTSMKYTIEKITTCNSLFPNIEFDKQLEEGSVRFRCHFRDPIMLATFFTYKGLTTTWTGTGDVMTFNFSTLTNQDKNIWVQLHVPDSSGASNHLDVFLDGGEIVSYTLTYNQGEPMIEEFEIKFTQINVATETDSTGAYAPDIDNGFDDESFNQTGIAEISTITTVAASALTTGEYFKIWGADGAGGWTAYYMWVNKDAGGGNPSPTGFTAIELTVTTGDSAATIAIAIGAALDGASDDFGTPGVVDTVVTVTQANTGDIKDAVDVDTTFTIATTTQGVTDVDGGWSNWDGGYTSKQCVMANQATFTFGGVAISDLAVQTFKLELNAPKSRYRKASSLSVAGSYLGTRELWKCTLDGVLTKGNVNMAEPSKTIANKTQGTVKMQYATTKYFQFTLARIEETTASGKASGEVYSATFNLNAGADSALTYSWTASEATDPSDMIDHTNI